MTDIEKVAEMYEIVSIVAANIVTPKPCEKPVDIINKLRATMKNYIQNYDDYELNSSITKTHWENYRKNVDDFIDLAKKIAISKGSTNQ